MPVLRLCPPGGGLIVCTILFASLAAPAPASTPLNDVQTAAAEWARIRSETTRLEKDWAAEKEVLNASISGLDIQAGQIARERDTLLAQTAQERDAIEKATAANQHTAERIDDAGQRVTALGQRLIALRPALPPRLSTALELPYRSIASADTPPAERMRHTMTILNRCNQFNQTFVLSEEVLPITPGSEPRLLEVIYWGLAQGCALDRAANQAYVGRPVNGTWTWQAAPDLVGEVTRLIAIHQDKTAPAFVRVPAQVSGGAR